MASISIPAPGKKIRDPQNRRKWIEIGHCVKPCNHEDCKANRAIAATNCGICGEPIGYDRQFFGDSNWQNLVHATCEYRRIDAEREARRNGEAAQ